MFFSVSFELGLVILLSNEGKCSVISANFINYITISNTVSLKYLFILTL